MKTSAKSKRKLSFSLDQPRPRSIPHRYQWILDSLSDQPSFLQKRMFGSLACYLDGKLVLALTGQNKEPWYGILVATERQNHKSLMAEFPSLKPHPILGKWLYLPESTGTFEETANRLVERILERDPRIGVETRGRGRFG
ncbi:MAG: hypothetical protein PHX83_05385 [Acidobacteriia bacterium]|nr:hypothetical protein [Terriglobia bacterium]